MKKMLKFVFALTVFFSMFASAGTKILNISGDTSSSSNFGVVAVGQSVTKQITLHNYGNETLHVSQLYLHSSISSNYDTPTWSGDIAPNSSKNISVTFRPTDTEYYNGAIYVESDMTGGEYDFNLEGAIPTRILRVEGNTDSELNFGPVELGQSKTKTITLFNDGNSPLTVSSLYLHPSIIVNYDNPTWNGVIPADGNKTLDITFRPTSTPNSIYDGTLYVVSNMTEGEYELNLKGKLPTRILRITGDTESEIDFGTVAVGDHLTKSITLHNDGNSPLTISSLYLHPSVSINYDNPTTNITIPSGSSQDIDLTFRPTNTPYYSGLVYVASDMTGGEYEINIKGAKE